jgi:hypothetical protein
MANVFPSSPILATLMIEALHSSETSVLARAIWHNIPEEGILHTKLFVTMVKRLQHLHSYIIIIPNNNYGHFNQSDTRYEEIQSERASVASYG